MPSALEKAMDIVDWLGGRPAGASITEIAQARGMPPSGVHRTLAELQRLGFVRQDPHSGQYALTLRLAAMGLEFLAASGLTGLAQPTLDALAAHSRELVRLSVLDSDRLIWVGVAQGAVAGLVYDPRREQGAEVPLACSAHGIAWLATLPETEALERVAAQGLQPTREDPGADAPRDLTEVRARIARARRLGHALSENSHIAGMLAIAVAVRTPDGLVRGCLSLAGPSVRFDRARATALLPALQDAAGQLGQLGRAVPLFQRS